MLTCSLVSKFGHLIGGGVILAIYGIGVILLIPVYMYRYLVCKISQYLNPSLGKMLTARGHVTVGNETLKTSRSTIVIAIGVATPKSVEEIIKIIVANLLFAKISPESDQLKYPEMQQYLTCWLGFRFWKPETNFSVDEHIKVIPLKEKTFSQNDLENLVEELLNEPFPHGRSPWSITVIENNQTSSKNPEDPSEKLCVLKFHHCLADGYGVLFTLVEALSSDALNFPVAKYAGDSRSLFATLGFLLTFPFRVLLECLELAAMFFEFHPWKIPDSRKSWKQIYMQSEIIPVNKIKEIKTRFGVSFASVVHSALASATRQSLLKKYGSHGDLRCTPCSIALPLPNHPRKLRNHFTAAHIKLPTKACDPLERLLLCEEDLQSAKRSTLPYLMKFALVLHGALTTPLLKLFARNRLTPVIISNFPGGAESEFEILGGKLVKIAVGLGACPGEAGICFLVYSSGNGIQFTVTAENALMTHEDVRHLLECVEKEIYTLYQLAVI